MILIFEPGKAVVTLEGVKEPSLEWLQLKVGGYIEVPIQFNLEGAPAQVVVNEEAVIHGMPINVPATEWLHRNVPPELMPRMLGGYIRGTMLVLTGPACMT
jgi:hypothetical protein